MVGTSSARSPDRLHNSTGGSTLGTRSRRLAALLSAVALVLMSTGSMALAKGPKAPVPRNPVAIQILGLNDFHGQLEAVPATATSGARIGALQGTFPNQTCTPGGTPNCIPAGGVEYLATHVRELRAQNPDNTVFVSAGDLIGATPLLSAAFHDEPTIEAFNLMDLDYNGVGNHEFDEGVDELLRMAYGDRTVDGYIPASGDGCHPLDGCGDGDGFDGAEFDFLAANVAYKATGETIFAPYAIHEFDRGARVAFIGMTLEGTPTIVDPSGIASVDFLDEAESVNALVPHLRAMGIRAIVVLLHEGGSVAASGNGAGNVDTINSCDSPSGALPPIVEAMNDEIDIVITGHTNWAVNCVIDGKIVTGAASQGRLITEIDARVSPASGDFVGPISVNNRIVTRDVARAADLTALIAEYNAVIGPIAGEVVGTATGPLTRTTVGGGGDSILGRLIADAQLAASDGAVIAFMNPGGIRADVTDATEITYGEAFSVQPFSNVVTTMDLTGAQIETLLEQQWTVNSGSSAGAARSSAQILQVSAGFTYTWDSAAPVGSRVDPASITLGGTTIDPGATYRVTMNSFLASGGDDFPVFTLGTNVVSGPDDLDALVDYLGDNLGYVPIAASRITRLPGPFPPT
jgi:5'-nucleotidase